MGPGDEIGAGNVEWIDLDSPPPAGGDGEPRPRVPGRYVLALVVSLALIVAFAVHRGQTHGPATARLPTSPAPHVSPSSSLTSSPITGRTPGPAGLVAVTELHRPLLDVPGTWELFARGPGVMARLQLARGRITRTIVPQLSSGGPVSFVVTPAGAIIRPLDFVTGYRVPDGRPAQDLTGRNMTAGPVFPGPDPGHIWIPSADNFAMTLADLHGHRTGPSLPVPPGGATSDGTGYLVFNDIGGVYDARPGDLRRITTGELLAVGPTRWLAAECDRRHRCGMVVIDRRSGDRRALRASEGIEPVRGVVSPDGSTAALVRTSADGALTPQLLDLRTGRARPVFVKLDEQGADGELLWSPDSQTLFAVTAQGHLVVIDRAAHVRELDVTLPALLQLAFRVRSP